MYWFDLQDGSSHPAHDSTVGYTVGLAGTGQPSISYPILHFHPAAFYALGSPTGKLIYKATKTIITT